MSIWPRLLTVAAAQDAMAGSKLAFLEEGYCTWALFVPGLLPKHMSVGTAVGTLILDTLNIHKLFNMM